MVGGKVFEITSKEDWAAKQSDSKNSGKPVRPAWTRCVFNPWVALSTNARCVTAQIIVDFSATWCGPCRVIGPYFEELSTAYPSLVFLKVDVDAVEARVFLPPCALCSWAE